MLCPLELKITAELKAVELKQETRHLIFPWHMLSARFFPQRYAPGLRRLALGALRHLSAMAMAREKQREKEHPGAWEGGERCEGRTYIACLTMEMDQTSHSWLRLRRVLEVSLGIDVRRSSNTYKCIQYIICTHMFTPTRPK